MTTAEQDAIMQLLETRGYNVSKQAVKYLDSFGRDDDEAFVNEFLDWYESQYQKVIGGGDVLNFMIQREGFLKKKQNGFKSVSPEDKDR